jgi:hypothetical protein
LQSAIAVQPEPSSPNHPARNTPKPKRPAHAA